MHTFLGFFAWPNGGVWSNVLAMPLCAVVAFVAGYLGRDRLGRALRPWVRRHLGHGGDLDAIRETLRTHADLLNHDSPGGLGAVMDEVRRAVAAAESAHEAVKALGVINKQAPRRGATAMQKKATGKADGG